MTRTIVITGASSGIGEALALHYAQDKARLGLLGTNAGRLAAVAEKCRALGAEVEAQAIDVRDRERMAAWLEAFDNAHSVDLLFANAGLLGGLAAGEAIERADQSFELMDVNVMGVLNTIHPLLPRMTARRKGQIAITSSVAGLLPLQQMPSYSASKAAVLRYGLCLRDGLRAHGVKVSVICPGYIDTPMTGQVQGAKPFMRSAAYAAGQIARGLERNRPIIAFPWYFAWVRRRHVALSKFSIAPKR
jgi:NADP-dependent 3-hydroxy acid dehydrogenase YdfG